MEVALAGLLDPMALTATAAPGATAAPVAMDRPALMELALAPTGKLVAVEAMEVKVAAVDRPALAASVVRRALTAPMGMVATAVTAAQAIRRHWRVKLLVMAVQAALVAMHLAQATAVMAVTAGKAVLAEPTRRPLAAS